MRGLTEKTTLSGVRPFLVVTRTMPLPRSPYSAEGTPVMTSTDSMFSTDRLRVPTPCMPLKLALSPIRTPLISTAVPKAALPAVEPPARSERAESVVRSGLRVFPPGNRAATPPMLFICRWSSAVRSIFWVVLMLSLDFSAVTTTSSRARELTERVMTRSSMLAETASFRVSDT